MGKWAAGVRGRKSLTGFETVIRAELSQLPSGSLEAWWGSCDNGLSFASLSTGIKNELELGWLDMVQVCEWAVDQLTQLREQWIAHPDTHISCALMTDRQRLNKAGKGVSFQTVLHSKDYARMYEL